MRKARPTESDEQRQERLDQNAQTRRQEASAEDKAMDAAVRRSINNFGA